MTDFPEIGYGTVHGRFLAGVLDDIDPVVNPTPPGFEPEVAPDAEALGGYVTFSATAPVVRVVGAVPAPATLFPQSLRVYLDDEGYLSRDGSRDITLWATDDPDGNPVNWQWRVTFSLNHKGHGVYHAPFNFELPTDSVVDLTVVAPLVTPSPGTIIIQGPEGPPSTVPGPPGEPGPPGPPGSGLTVYPDVASLDLIREPEVGTLFVPNLAAAFPSLAGAYTDIFPPYPADLLVTTSAMTMPMGATTQHFVQEFVVADTSSPWHVKFSRTISFRTVDGGFWNDSTWFAIPTVPRLYADDVPIGSPVSPYPTVTINAVSGADPNTLVKRDGFGRSQISDPRDPEDITNKKYVDEAIGAIPPTGGALTVYPDLATAKAVREPGIGILHITNGATEFAELGTYWAGDGPADYVFETSVHTPPAGSGGPAAGLTIVQTIKGGNGLQTNNIVAGAHRVFNYLPGDPESTVPFAPDPTFPGPYEGYTIVGVGTGPTAYYNQVMATPNALNSSVIRRSATGTAMVQTPVGPTDIANKQYADKVAGKYSGLSQWQGTALTISSGYQGSLMQMMHVDPTVVTLPATGINVGFQVDVVRYGGPVTFAVGADGAVVRSATGLALRAPYSVATAIKMTGNEWLVVGDLA